MKFSGLDFYYLNADLNDFIETATSHMWQVYEIKRQQEISFYASLKNRHDIIRTYPDIRLCYTSGVFGMLIRSIWRIERITGLLLFCIIWYLLSNTIFEIEILGEGEQNRQILSDTLKNNQFTVPLYLPDKMIVEKSLQDDLQYKFSWIELNREGSYLKIRFLPEKQMIKDEITDKQLYASKDGIIAYFEIEHGEKAVQIHDVVKKGDLLVKNQLNDSFNQPHPLLVKGKVYAYTWHDFEVIMKQNQLPKAVVFYQLLFKARNQISKEISDGEKIVSENILHFTSNKDTINMKLHYTLLEDISGTGE